MKDRFITIAVFQYSSEALIIKGKLEVENIDVFLVDEYTVDTDPLVSNAIGGVKLQVYFDQGEKAKEIVRAIDPKLLKEKVVCHNCKSENIKMIWSVKGILQKLFPFGDKFRYRCKDCNFEFKDKEVL